MVTVLSSPINGDSLIHSHEFEELVLITSGSGLHIVGGNKSTIETGDVFIIREGMKHEFSKCTKLTMLNLVYDRQELISCAGDLKDSAGFHALFSLVCNSCIDDNYYIKLNLSADDFKKIVDWAEEIAAEINEKKPGFNTICRANFMRIVTFLSRSYTDLKSNKNGILAWKLGSIIAYLENNYSSEITVEEMAKKFNLSLRQFYRIFSDATGYSPRNYLLSIRIKKASQILASTNLSINEIAYMCGFTDSNYFARAFKKITKVSPSLYRKRRLS